MAKISIEDIVEHLDHEVKRALERDGAIAFPTPVVQQGRFISEILYTQCGASAGHGKAFPIGMQRSKQNTEIAMEDPAI